MATASAITLALLLSAQATLAACYGTANQGANAAEVVLRRGIKGEVDLFSAQPINTQTAIWHPAQIVYHSTRFVGWGTRKGHGVDNCASYYGTRWQIYIDGRDLGNYFCEQHYGDVSDTAQNQFFRIEYTTCPGDGIMKFVVYWNSAWKSCKSIGASGGYPSAGSESVNTIFVQNLKVRYSAIRVKPLPSQGGDWRYMSALDPCEDYPYSLDSGGVSTWTVNVSP